jgi:carbon storage regulator CsrA
VLVIQRKPGQDIEVDGPARFKVVSIRGNRVNIGVEAEGSTKIVRSELLHSPPEPRDVDDQHCNLTEPQQ